jgi:hypothetical protein
VAAVSGYQFCLLILGLLVIQAVAWLHDQPVCVVCGGRSAHRADCPEKK